MNSICANDTKHTKYFIFSVIQAAFFGEEINNVDFQK